MSLERRATSQKVRVDERRVVAVAALSGLASVGSDVHPTGSTPVDLVLVASVAGVVAWAGASASWWMLTVAAGVAAAVSVAPVPAAVGLVAAGIGCWIGARRADLAEVRAGVAGVAALVGGWSELDGRFGLSAAIIVPLCVALTVHGVRRRPSAIRRRGWQVAGVAGGVTAVVVVLFGLSVLGARSSLTEGLDLTRDGVRAVQNGDLDAGASRLRAAADRLDSADRTLSVVWTEPVRFIPVVAQHRRAVVELAADSALAMRVAADALDRIDADRLKVAGGRVDLAALDEAVGPLREVQTALAGLDRTVADVRSPWLLPPVTDRLDDAADELTGNLDRFDTAIDTLELAPAMLGRDEQRRYLVLFTTPSEARGVGGFPGNYAELTVDAGALSMTGFGRLSDLDRAAFAAGASCDGCPDELLDEYGGFGLTTGPGGSVGEVVWKNITMPAHFPYIAEAAAVLYPRSGRPDIDGVALMDPYVMQTFVGYTGPVELPQGKRRIDRASALPYILFEQYLGENNVERIDALEVIARTVIDRLLTGELPEPQVLASDLGPLVSERRLLFWSNRADEQEVLERSGLLGSLPGIDAAVDAGFAVTLTNASGNKIDAFVEVSTATEFSTDPMTGRRTLAATVTITNTAPSEGLPPFIIGNLVDRPMGTNRTFVRFYSTVGPRSIERDGVPVGLDPGREAGWVTGSAFVDVPPGGSTTYRLEFDVPVTSGPDGLVTWTQPLVADRADLGPLAPPPAQ